MLSISTAPALKEQVNELRSRADAVILAHNYQPLWVKELADFRGDSLQLSRKATTHPASTIVFCGVEFMAESAKLLSPEKRVLLPAAGAGCSLADSITTEQLAKWKTEYSDAIVVAYVNTSAAVKALSDVCCTSANAVEIVGEIPRDRTVLFLPDLFLGSYVAERTRHPKLKVWMGECHVHAGIAPEELAAKVSADPDAELFIHPECGCTSEALYRASEIPGAPVKLLSTTQMIEEARRTRKKHVLVATEIGIINDLQAANPGTVFEPVNPSARCPYMNLVTPQSLIDSLANGAGEVRLELATMERAALPLRAMLDPALRPWRSV